MYVYVYICIYVDGCIFISAKTYIYILLHVALEAKAQRGDASDQGEVSPLPAQELQKPPGKASPATGLGTRSSKPQTLKNG